MAGITLLGQRWPIAETGAKKADLELLDEGNGSALGEEDGVGIRSPRIEAPRAAICGGGDGIGFVLKRD